MGNKLTKMIRKLILKHRPWSLISYLSKLPLMTNLLQYLYYTYFSELNSIKIHINSKCNYNCVYCYSKNIKGEVLPTQKWLETIDKLKDYPVQTIEISGGEPFLHKDLFKILKKCSDINYNITIYTNGSLINKNWIKKLKSLDTHIILSIKYDSVNTYSKCIRSKHSLKKIENNIQALVNNKISVVTFITVTKKNIRYVKRLINRSIELGAFPVIERYVPVKDCKINDQLSINAMDWFYVTKLINKVYSNYKHLIDGVNKIQGRTCSCYTTQVSIMQNGDVLPCQFLPPSMKIGNITNNSLEDVWLLLQNKRKEWLKIPDECKHCKNKLICRGGCRTSAYYMQGTFLRKDPLCGGNYPTTFGHSAFIVIHTFQYKKVNNKLLNKV